MWAISFSYILIGKIILYFTGEDTVFNAVLISVLGFVTCFAYQIAVLPGIIYLLFWVNVKEKKCQKIIPFIWMVLGGVISVVAPGNYVRHSVIDSSGLQIADALYYSLYDTTKIVYRLLKNPVNWGILIFFIMLGMKYSENKFVKLRNIVIGFFISVGCLYLTAFPLALGYSSTNMPIRIRFILNSSFLVLLVPTMMCLGGYLAKTYKQFCVKRCKASIALFVLLMVMIMLFIGERYKEIPYYKYITQVETCKTVNEQWVSILNEIKDSKDEDVVVYSEKINAPLLKEPGITDDADEWVNQAVATVYNKKSVRIIWQE
jgi:hypothetical protein